MKKLVCLVLVFMMVFTMIGMFVISKAKAETPNVNGMVFLYFKFPAVAYQIFSKTIEPDTLELQNPKWAGLINQGEIKEVHIRIPLSESFIYVYYPNPNGFVRKINLKFYSIGQGYILFIFKGEIS
jgi:hypothetical protein